jgi:hypothetical protein
MKLMLSSRIVTDVRRPGYVRRVEPVDDYDDRELRHQ